MKKRLQIVFAIFLVAISMSLFLTACNDKPDVIRVDYIVEGSVYQSGEFEINEISAFVPAKTGTYFDGWYLDEKYSDKYSEDLIKGKTELKLYGRLVYNSYVFEYYYNAQLIESCVIDDLQKFEFAEPPIIDGVHFDGWSYGSNVIDKDNLTEHFVQFGKYQLTANYNCLHTKLGKEFVKNLTCVHSGEKYAVCLNCSQTIYLGSIPPLGHIMIADYDCDDVSHWHNCERCDERLEEQTHSLTEVHSCSVCLNYLNDEPMAGSKITTLGRRQAIDYSFKNLPNLNGGTLKMVTINIGQGDCIFIKFPDGKTMVMDAGHVMTKAFENNFGRLDDVLKNFGVKQLDYLFITHSDYDHIRCVEKLLKNYQIKNIYIPKASDKHNSNTYEDVVKAIASETYSENGVKKQCVVRYHIGDYQIAGDGWQMKCHTYLEKDYPIVTDKNVSSSVAAGAKKDEIINSLSPVCLLEYAGRTIVLTGDSNQFNEKYLLDRGVLSNIDADILKVAHHGSATSTTAEFLSAVKCEYALISHGGLFGHPTQIVLDRLVESGCSTIYETQKDGNINVSIFGSGALCIDAQNSDDKDVNDEVAWLNLFLNRLCCPNYSDKRAAHMLR